MSAPSLDVLRLQAEHIRQQADTLRQHCGTHWKCAVEARDYSIGHLATAVACCEAIDVLAERVHACITCAIDAQKPLPACARDPELDTRLRREKAENDAREARVDADRDGVFPYGKGGAA